MIKDEIQRERDALKERLEYLRDFYQQQKDLLREQYEEDKYLEEQEEKRRRIAEIEAELAMLQYDDSAWAQRRRLELMQELADAQADLDDYEREHAIQSAQDYLDELYEQQEEEINNEIDLLDERENDAIALYQQALDDIRNGSIELYNEMIEWNSLYGDGITETITNAWEEAYRALQAYMDLFGEAYEGINLGNYTGYNPEGSWDDHPINGGGGSGGGGGSNNSGSSPTLEPGATIQVKSTATNYSPKAGGGHMASFVPGGSFTVYRLDGDEVLIGRDGVYTGWIYKHDIVGYARGTRKATRGWREVDELGPETLFASSDGSHYRLFAGGEKVLNSRASNFLYDFATNASKNGNKVFDGLIKRLFGSGPIDYIRPITGHNEVTMGNIIINGDTNEATVSEIRRAQRDSLNSLLREFDRLNR